MADNTNDDAHSEATKWFVIAVVGTILYVAAVYAFVINGELGDEGRDNAPAEVEDNGQPH